MKVAPRTLFGRLAQVIVLTLAALAATVGLLSIRPHVAEAERAVEDEVRQAAALLEPVARRRLRGDPAAARELEHLARDTRLHVTVLAADGTVVFDSGSPRALGNLSSQPEFLAARADGEGVARRARTPGSPPEILVAHRLTDERGGTSGFVRVGKTFEGTPGRLDDLIGALLLGLALALLLGLLVASRLTAWLNAPLRRIVERIEEIAALQLRGKVRVHGPIEVRRLARALNHASSRLARRVESMERSRRELDAIHASMREGVIAVDARERVVLMNDAAARLLGLAQPLPAGAELWRAVRFPELEQALRSVLAGEREWKGDATAPSDSNRTLNLSVTRVEPGNGAVALLSDVTEIRSLDRVRIDFVANVSHEVRTPLSAVLAALETLSDPSTKEEDRRRFLAIARRNAERLQSIVEDLLDLSAIESEGARMPMEPIALEAPVRRAVSAMQAQAEDKGVRLRMEPPPAGDLVVLGNGKRLEQVFVNLIDNAVKYTPPGGEIVVRIGPGEKEGEAAVSVEDTGVGIPQASLPRVFERFYRVDRHRSREVGGTGLGLAIVKHCVHAHGGRVKAQSEEGRGATFIVFLPLARETPPS